MKFLRWWNRVSRYSPEEALLNILEDLKNILKFDDIIKVIPAGSVVLGTYVNIPDIDIIIECSKPYDVMRTLQRTYPQGHRKIGELRIWYVPKIYGYPMDFTVYGPDEPKTQTIKHVEYFQNVLTDDMRERVRELKRFFKDINCYGAEVGGITGICITRMAEKFPTVRDALYDLFQNLVHWKRYYISDPVLDERNLFASVTKLKRGKMIRPILMYHWKDERTVVDLNYFFDNYDRIYRIRRNKTMGTDREFQFVYTSIRKVWKEMKQRIRWWKPTIDYDILFMDRDICVGATISPEKLEGPAYELIPIEVLSKKAHENLKRLGAKPTEDLAYLRYERKPPFKNVTREFDRLLFTRLSEKYIELERI